MLDVTKWKAVATDTAPFGHLLLISLGTLRCYGIRVYESDLLGLNVQRADGIAAVALIADKAAELGAARVCDVGPAVVQWPENWSDVSEKDVAPGEVLLGEKGISIAGSMRTNECRAWVVADGKRHSPKDALYRISTWEIGVRDNEGRFTRVLGFSPK